MSGVARARSESGDSLREITGKKNSEKPDGKITSVHYYYG